MARKKAVPTSKVKPGLGSKTVAAKLDLDLWRKLKLRSFDEGVSGATVIVEALEEYLSNPSSGRGKAKPKQSKRSKDVEALEDIEDEIDEDEPEEDESEEDESEEDEPEEDEEDED
jgi:hypothetical protein